MCMAGLNGDVLAALLSFFAVFCLSRVSRLCAARVALLLPTHVAQQGLEASSNSAYAQSLGDDDAEPNDEPHDAANAANDRSGWV